MERAHTYHVGRSGVWVHNTGSEICQQVGDRTLRFIRNAQKKNLNVTEELVRNYVQRELREQIGDAAEAEYEKHFRDVVNDLLSRTRRYDRSLNGGIKEAAEEGLSPRDPHWPWRGSHKTEQHHPLMQGKSFQEFWKARGWTPRDVKRFKEGLDTDVHRAISESGYWDSTLMKRILDHEATQFGLPASRSDVERLARKLLAEIRDWETRRRK